MNYSTDPDILLHCVIVIFFFLLGFAILWGVLFLTQFFLTLPMRRAERARLFLDLVETAINDGRPVEETIISISHSQEPSVGVRFHLFAAWLEEGLPFADALARVPRFLPPQVSAMLRAGQKLGDLRKVIPACRQLLKDALSEERGAVSYVLMVTLFTMPLGFVIFTLVIPKLVEIGNGVLGASSDSLSFLVAHGSQLLAVQAGILLLLALAAFLYAGGPRVVAWFPILERLYYRLPWRRKRMQRDFSTMLGLLLDAGVPEPEAVRLAADCSANRVFRRRAERVIERLAQGVKLPDAVQALDDAGEFGWRLRNAFHARTGFLRSLIGWHESLDAKAFQQQQAAAHGITSALVLWNGLFVASIAVSMFLFLVAIIDAAVLW